MSATATSDQGIGNDRMIALNSGLMPYPEYLTSAGDELVTNDYVYGSIWCGVPGALRKLPVDGHFSSVGGGGGRWAALDPGSKKIVVGSVNGYNTIKSQWAPLACAIAAGRECLWLALPESILRISLTGDVLLDSLRIEGGTALAVDVDHDRVAVTCTERHRVVLVDEGSRNFQELSVIDGRSMRFPRGASFSPDGSLWISDTENRRVVNADRNSVFDFTNHPGFPVGLASHNDRLWLAFPYERLLTPLDEASACERHHSKFYPYSIACFEDDLWTSHPATGIVRSHRRRVTYDGLADPIAIVSWRDQLAVAERDRACVTCFQHDAFTCKIALPEGSQPRALTVSPDGVLWIATQTPKLLFACRDGRTAEFVCNLELDGVPRSMAWTKSGIALAGNRTNGILWIHQKDGRAINEFPLPEPPVSLTSDGDTVFAGLERRGVVIAFNGTRVKEIASDVVTPRGLLLEGNRLIVVESLAHRIRSANYARDVNVA